MEINKNNDIARENTKQFIKINMQSRTTPEQESNREHNEVIKNDELLNEIVNDIYKKIAIEIINNCNGIRNTTNAKKELKTLLESVKNGKNN